MKKSKFLTILAVISLMFSLVGMAPVFAEDNQLKEGVVIEENTGFPDNDAHYQVTFTYKASSSSVTKVSLVGNFTFYTEEDAKLIMDGKPEKANTYLPTEYKDGMFQTGYGVPEKKYVPIEMEDKGNDFYQITLPLPGCLYFYGFVEDDDLSNVIKDKTNLPVANGDSDSGWSMIYVGNANDCLEGQEYIYPRTDNKKGSLSFVDYTAVDGTKQSLGIYLPYGYNKNETYKTLYVSHGGGGNEVEWMYIGSAVNIMDNLIAEGSVEKTILVTMDNQYFNFDMEQINKNFIEKIIPYVEANYSVSKKAEDRAIAGLSNGGWTVVNEMVNAQDTFGYYGIFSPNYRAKDILDEATKDQLASLAHAKLYYLCSGTVDDGMGRQDRYGTVNGVHQALLDNGTNVKFEWKNGAHDWGVWRACLTTFAKDYLWSVDEKTTNKVGVSVGKNTLFTDTTPDAHYQATFTLDASKLDSKKKVASIQVGGNMQFYTEDQLNDYLKNEGKNSPEKLDYAEFVMSGYRAEEYKEGMFTTGVALDLLKTGNVNYLYDLKQTKGGLWTVTIPLPGGQYYYDYVVTYTDGTKETIKDPANMPFDNKGKDSGHSLFYVGNGNDCLPGEEYVFPRNDGKVGKVDFVGYPASDGTTQQLGIYTPYGYSADKTYKTLYLSHGGGGNEVEWFFIGSAKNIFDNLIASGEMEPTIIVTMDNQSAPFDFETGESLKNITENIIPFVEKNYSVSTKRSDRAMAGLSSGASVTVQAMLQANDTFDYYGVFSPSRTLDFMDGTLTDEMRTDMKDAALYYVSCGIYDAYLRRNNDVQVYDELVASGANAIYEWKNGTHDWAVWRAQLTTFAKDYLWSVEKVNSSIDPEKPTTSKPQETVISKKPNAVKTGDTTNIIPAIIMGTVSLAVIAVIVYKRKKEFIK